MSFKRRREGDTDIPMLEYTSGRIESLLKTKGSYNRGIKLLKKRLEKMISNIFPQYWEMVILISRDTEK
ncbi:MAG: hypothetical protein IPN57_06445 [Ignavibacteria bacterium]|nr:hypothetical protein [Ignavibacteria bacterium]